jgi:hypothetical protein
LPTAPPLDIPRGGQDCPPREGLQASVNCSKTMNARMALLVLTVSICVVSAVFASQEQYLQWNEVRIVSPETGDAGKVVFEAKVDGDNKFVEVTIEAFAKKYSVEKEDLRKLDGFPLSSLAITHEPGYAELGGYTVHFKFRRTTYKEGKPIHESIMVDVSKGKGLKISDSSQEVSEAGHKEELDAKRIQEWTQNLQRLQASVEMLHRERDAWRKERDAALKRADDLQVLNAELQVKYRQLQGTTRPVP